MISISAFDDASTAAADVVLPAETHAEKEGTVTHPDGRLQRLRRSVPHPGNVRSIWQVLAELAARLGDETGIDSAPEALEAIAAEVPFYAGLTHEEIGGHGIRWQERRRLRRRCRRWVRRRSPKRHAKRLRGSPRATGDGGLRLGTYRHLWADETTDRNVALQFLAQRQTVELAVADGERLGLKDGDEVEVRSNGTSVRARVDLRERMRPGAAFLIEGTAENNANALAGAETVEVTKP